MRVARVACVGLGFFGVASGCFAIATPIAPEILYEIEAALPEPQSSDLEEWSFTGGGYVLRVDLDITGDGRPELFVATSLSMYRGSPKWRVYRARKEGGYAPFLTPAEIKAGWTPDRTMQIDSRFGFSMGQLNGKPAIAIPWHDRFAENEEERWGETLIQFNGATIDFLRANLDENWEGDAFSGTAVPLEELARGVMIVDLLRDPNASWRPVSINRGVPSGDGYFLDPADEDRVKKLSAFTPKLAWEWLRGAYAGKFPKPSESGCETWSPHPSGSEVFLTEGTPSMSCPISAEARSRPAIRLLQQVREWRGPLSGGATVLVAGWGLLRWRHRRSSKISGS